MRSVPENTKQRYQTKFVQPQNGINLARDNGLLATMDRDGWELIGVVALTPVNVILAFKRPYDHMVDFEHKPEVASAFKGTAPRPFNPTQVSKAVKGGR